MRFSLYFSTLHTRLPVNFRRAVLSFIKQALSEAYDIQVYEEFFYLVNQKPYTFAVELHKPVYSDSCVTVAKNTFRVTFSVLSFQLAEYKLFYALAEQLHRPFHLSVDNSMTLYRIVKDKEPVITDNKILVRSATGGGICVRNHNRETNRDIYLSLEDETFEKDLNEITCNSLNYFKIPASSDNLHISVLKGKKILVRHFDLIFPITAGYFMIEGDPVILQSVMNLGLGSRRSQGFAKIDLVR